jgi:hypothetical protein
MPNEYAPPVSDLLSFGRPLASPEDWHAYVDDFGFAPEHVSDLVRMATDAELACAPADSEELWGPVHAWRVLGQLRAPEAIVPLVDLIRASDDDWISTDLPVVFALIGPDALPALAALLQDRAAGQEGRMTAASALRAIAQRHYAHRGPVVDLLSRALDQDPPDPGFNGHLVNELLDLNAVEAAAAMERAFAAGRVDEFAAGDWEDVQVELGLLPERLTPRPPGPIPALAGMLKRVEELSRLRRARENAARERPPLAAPPESRKARDRAKSRKKMAKKSRKQNRR